MKTLFWAALRNLKRSSARSFLTFLAMMSACSLLMLTLSVNDGILVSMIEAATDRYYGHGRVRSLAFMREPDLHHVLPSTSLPKPLDGLVAAPRLRAFALASKDENKESLTVEVLGVDVFKENQITSLLKPVEGKPLGKESKGASLGYLLAQRLGLQVGDSLTIVAQGAYGSTAGALLQVEGFIRTGDSVRDGALVVLNLEHLAHILGLEPSAHEWILGSISHSDLLVLAHQCKESLEIKHWEELIPQLAALKDFWKYAQIILISLFYLAVILITWNTIAMSILQRSHEIAVLRVIGLMPVQALILLTMEAGILSFSASVCGALLGSALIVYLAFYPVDLSGLFPEIRWSTLAMAPQIRGIISPVAMIIPPVIILFLGPLCALPVARNQIRIPMARQLAQGS